MKFFFSLIIFTVAIPILAEESFDNDLLPKEGTYTGVSSKTKKSCSITVDNIKYRDPFKFDGISFTATTEPSLKSDSEEFILRSTGRSDGKKGFEASPGLFGGQPGGRGTSYGELLKLDLNKREFTYQHNGLKIDFRCSALAKD